MPGTSTIALWERELWLVRAVHRLRPVIAGRGLVLPNRITVRAGETSLSNSGSGHALGECWPSTATTDGVPGIVINATITNPATILSTLVHELVHAADDCISQHGQWFVAWARALGLEGNMPSTYAGPRLQRTLGAIARDLGAYPAPQYGYTLSRSGRLLA